MCNQMCVISLISLVSWICACTKSVHGASSRNISEIEVERAGTTNVSRSAQPVASRWLPIRPITPWWEMSATWLEYQVSQSSGKILFSFVVEAISILLKNCSGIYFLFSSKLECLIWVLGVCLVQWPLPWAHLVHLLRVALRSYSHGHISHIRKYGWSYGSSGSQKVLRILCGETHWWPWSVSTDRQVVWPIYVYVW